MKPLATLVNPFPSSKEKKMVVRNPNPLQQQPSGSGHASREDVSFMMKSVWLQTRT